MLVAAGVQNGVGVIQFLDAKNPTLPPLEQLEVHRAAVSNVKFTHDGKFMLTGGFDSLVQIWQLPELLLAGTVMNIESEVKQLSVNYDDQYFAAIAMEDQTYIYSVEQCIAGGDEAKLRQD